MSTNSDNNSRITLFIVMTASLLLAFSGCTNRELDELTIITCIEIGLKNNAYEMQAEAVRLNDPEAEPGQKTQIITASGSTFTECINALNEVEAPNIYLGHLRLIILNKSFIDNSNHEMIDEIVEFSVKNPEIRFNTELAASNEAFGEAINAQSASTGNRGIDLSENIRKLNTKSELCDLINHIDGYSAPPELPVISILEMNGNNTAVIHSSEYIPLNFS